MSKAVELAGVRVLVAEGPLASDRDAADLVGQALSEGATTVAVPVAQLAPEFLDLKTRQAGELLQKFVNYGLCVAVVGDVSQAAAQSKPLADFVRESNRGRHVWFVDDVAALEAKLAGVEA
ncbi:DUF4180 domain-containing protein [Phenylobacterium sp.]|jgi:hypothetical protein|uniref:DUF4180 domain-containing protein n=1 Tax=Phenylobacterium sp. TaxID=1871053 RepID=UPI002F94748D